jgi:hypothetical protein
MNARKILVRRSEENLGIGGRIILQKYNGSVLTGMSWLKRRPVSWLF